MLINENEKYIKEMYKHNIYNIIDYENNKNFHIINNIEFKENYFKINNISIKNIKLIFDYLKENYLIKIISLYSYRYNLKNSFKNVNRYNYINMIENYFKLIFKYEFFNLLSLFYFHLIDNEINLNI